MPLAQGQHVYREDSDPSMVYYEDIHAALHEDTAAFLSALPGVGVSRAFWAILLWKTWVLKTGNCVLKKRVKGKNGKDWNVLGKWHPFSTDIRSTHVVLEGWYRCSCGFRGNPSHVWFSYTPETTTYIVNNCLQNGVQDRILRCAIGGDNRVVDSLLRPLAVDGFIAEAASYAWGAELLQPRLTLVAYVSIPELTVTSTADFLMCRSIWTSQRGFWRRANRSENYTFYHSICTLSRRISSTILND